MDMLDESQNLLSALYDEMFGPRFAATPYHFGPNPPELVKKMSHVKLSDQRWPLRTIASISYQIVWKEHRILKDTHDLLECWLLWIESKLQWTESGPSSETCPSLAIGNSGF